MVVFSKELKEFKIILKACSIFFQNVKQIMYLMKHANCTRIVTQNLYSTSKLM